MLDENVRRLAESIPPDRYGANVAMALGVVWVGTAIVFWPTGKHAANYGGFMYFMMFLAVALLAVFGLYWFYGGGPA